METILFWVLIISAVAFIIQTLIGIFGGDIDLPDEGVGGFFTLRNVISFLLGLSVVGYFTVRSGYAELLALLGGVGFGIFLIFANMALMRLLYKLEQRNEIQPHEYRGIYATVT
ncbi:MAG: hypothetical protein LBV04_00740, partial [Deferribacteraceae bacterium]|nr:hypothetical protein [Deferribacteraceae bacterium]